jgi:hypothetical protein
LVYVGAGMDGRKEYVGCVERLEEIWATRNVGTLIYYMAQKTKTN